MALATSTPEKKQKHTDYMREWTRKNAAAVNERRRLAREAKPGYNAAQQREWRKKNPDAVKQYNKADREKHGEQRRAEARARHAANPAKNSEANKAWREKNADYVYQKRQRDRREKPAQMALNRCRRAAKDQNLPFNLEIGDIVVPTHCPILGMEFTVTEGKRTDSSLSVDRIVPKLGYVKGNIVVVSWRANRIKNDSTPDELAKLAQFYSAIAYPPA